VFTGFLDRSVPYGVLEHTEMLGPDLVEVQRVMKAERYLAPRNPGPRCAAAEQPRTFAGLRYRAGADAATAAA
jgi:hypothetical protein